jgi:hypothetical protein
MIEIFSLYLQLITFVIIFQFPLNKVILNKYSLLKFDYFGVLILNIIIHSFLYLIISFTSIDLQIYFFLQVFLGIVFLIFNLSFFFKNFKITLNDNISLFIIFLLLNMILFTHIALNLKIEWDGLAHWIYKAQVYFQGGTFSDIKNVPFSYYPQFGTFLWGFFWKNSFLQLEYFGRLVLPFFYLSGILFCVSSMFKKENLLLKILLLLLIITLTLDYYLLGGYQDYYLFFELLIFSKLFYIYQKKNSTLLFGLLFLDLVLILWTKQEGFFYNIILTIIFLIFCNKNYKTRFLFVVLVVSSLLLQIYLKNTLIGSFEFNEKILHYDLLKYLQISQIFETFALISKHIVISMFRYPIWILVILVLIFSQIFNTNSKLFKFSIVYLLMFFILVYAIYFQTTLDLNFLLPITIDRILLQGSGFMIYPILTFFEKFIEKKDN